VDTPGIGLWGTQLSQNARQRPVGRGNDDPGVGPRRFILELRHHENGAGTRLPECCQIPSRGEKREIAGTRAVKGGHSGDGDIAVSDERTAGEVSDLAGG